MIEDGRTNTGGRRVPGKAVALGLLAVVGTLALASSGPPQGAGQDDSGPVGHTKETLDKWVQTQQLISKEKKDWRLGKEMLHDRIDLVQHEIDSLQSSIDEAQKSISDAEAKRGDLVTENDALQATAKGLDEVIGHLEERTRGLVQRLPDPIRERIEPLIRRLPDPDHASDVSLGERFQNVIGILNEVDKFAGEITVTSEVRKLGDGTSIEVSTMYVGLGQAYYTSADDEHAGVGRPGEGGWKWTPVDGAGPRIAEAIEIYQSEKAAAYVALPTRVE